MIKLAAAASPPSAQKTSFKSFLKKAKNITTYAEAKEILTQTTK